MHREGSKAARAVASRAEDTARLAVIKLGTSDALLRLPEVLAVYPVSASVWWQGIREGRFPAGVKIGARCTAWRSASIRALIAAAGTTDRHA